MRSILFKNNISRKSRKREICVEEIIKQDGCISRTVKRSLYFIKSITPIKSQEEFNSWMKTKGKQCESQKRDFHIMKIHSDSDRSDTVICKALGSFYVVVGHDIFNIVFLHSLRLQVSEAVTK